MGRRTATPVIAALVAIAITTALDAAGLTQFSALPLLPLVVAAWLLTRFSRRAVGVAWGPVSAYSVALLHPSFTIGAITLIAATRGAVDLSSVAWTTAWAKVAAVGAATVIAALLTEEGFFRGWLWAAFEHGGLRTRTTWIVTSAVFALWHLSGVLLPTGFDVPLSRVPIFIANAAVLGAIWGLVRWRSGSIVASSVAHGIWNGIAYELFGFGTKIGALGIRDTALYGPEVGLLGLTLNAMFLAGLWLALRQYVVPPRPELTFGSAGQGTDTWTRIDSESKKSSPRSRPTRGAG